MFFLFHNGVSEKIGLRAFGDFKHFAVDDIVFGLYSGLFSAFSDCRIQIGFIIIFSVAFRKAPFGGAGIMDQKYGGKVGGKKDKSCTHVTHTFDLL